MRNFGSMGASRFNPSPAKTRPCLGSRMSLVLATLPVFLVILCGYGLMVSGLMPRNHWHSIETLAFRLLIPAFLVNSVAQADLSSVAQGAFVPAILITVALVAAIVFGLRLVLGASRMPNPVFTSLFQGGVRWNAFVGLTAAEQFMGPEALLWLAVAIAVTVPIINVVSIAVLAAYGTARATVGGVLLRVLRNPIVQGCVVGLTLNLSGLGLPQPIFETLDLIGRAALGIGLLTVGAALTPARLFQPSIPLAMAIVLRPVLAPVLFVAVAMMLGLPQVPTLAGSLVFAVPAAGNGYIVARQLGGDAELYASILTWQTLVCLAVLPVLAGAVTAFV